MPALNAKKLILAPWCEEPESEDFIKKETTKLSLEQTANEVRVKIVKMLDK